MDDPTQVPPGAGGDPPHEIVPAPPGAPSGVSTPERVEWPAPGGWPMAPDTIAVDGEAERAERGLWIWLGIVAVALVASVLFGEAQFGLFAAAGGTFAVAHAVERVPRWRLLHRFLNVIVTVGGALLFAGVVRFLRTTTLPPFERNVGIVASLLAIVASLALLLRPVVDLLVRSMFRGAASTPVTRLAARIVTLALLMSAPLWVAFRGMLALDLLKDMDLGGSSLWGSLIGLALLSLGGVGTFVRRTPAEAIARLGLCRFAPRDLLWLPLGVAGLAVLNTAIEWAQKTWFPAQWAFDQHVVGLMAGDLSRAETVMLGVSAGFGEELAMRGALQPRLGLALTALLFAALHVQYSWTGMGTIVLFGLALGLVRMRSSATTAIAIHAIYDMIAAFGAQQGR